MDEVTKGNRAEAILNDEVFLEAMERAKESIKKQWENEITKDGREALWHQLRALPEIKSALRVLVNRKDYATHQQEKKHGA